MRLQKGETPNHPDRDSPSQLSRFQDHYPPRIIAYLVGIFESTGAISPGFFEQLRHLVQAERSNGK